MHFLFYYIICVATLTLYVSLFKKMSLQIICTIIFPLLKSGLNLAPSPSSSIKSSLVS